MIFALDKDDDYSDDYRYVVFSNYQLNEQIFYFSTIYMLHYMLH